MNLQSFSKGSQELIESVAYFTASQKNPEVTPLHILYKLLELKAIKQLILKDKIQSISQLAMSKINKLPTLASLDLEDLYFSKSINSLVSYAEEEIRSLKAKEVMPVHLLLALFKVSETKEIFKKAELNKSDILNNLDTSSDQNTFLSKFTIDLTKLARNGELDPVIGRDVEIRRLMQILSRRSKNNPMLIGEPGVGKTAIAEALAKRIIDGDVPSNLLNKQLLSLDLGLLVAGAKFRGEFEERIKNIINPNTKKITGLNTLAKFKLVSEKIFITL